MEPERKLSAAGAVTNSESASEAHPVISLSEKLNSVGLKATSQRLKVLQVFHDNDQSYLNAEQVYRQATRDNAEVGLATVYRTLAQLTEVGILVRTVLECASGMAIYTLHGSKHRDILVCLRCDRVDDFVDETIEVRQRAVATSKGYILQRHRLTLYGFCAACQASATESA